MPLLIFGELSANYLKDGTKFPTLLEKIHPLPDAEDINLKTTRKNCIEITENECSLIDLQKDEQLRYLLIPGVESCLILQLRDPKTGKSIQAHLNRNSFPLPMEKFFAHFKTHNQLELILAGGTSSETSREHARKVLLDIHQACEKHRFTVTLNQLNLFINPAKKASDFVIDLNKNQIKRFRGNPLTPGKLMPERTNTIRLARPQLPIPGLLFAYITGVKYHQIIHGTNNTYLGLRPHQYLRQKVNRMGGLESLNTNKMIEYFSDHTATKYFQKQYTNFVVHEQLQLVIDVYKTDMDKMFLHDLEKIRKQNSLQSLQSVLTNDQHKNLSSTKYFSELKAIHQRQQKIQKYINRLFIHIQNISLHNLLASRLGKNRAISETQRELWQLQLEKRRNHDQEELEGETDNERYNKCGKLLEKLLASEKELDELIESHIGTPKRQPYTEKSIKPTISTNNGDVECEKVDGVYYSLKEKGFWQYKPKEPRQTPCTGTHFNDIINKVFSL